MTLKIVGLLLIYLMLLLVLAVLVGRHLAGSDDLER